MCALVQAIRMVGIVAGGPAVGEAANPMHIVRTTGVSNSQPPPDRPSSNYGGDTSFGQSKRIVEDPTTQVDDDRQPQTRYEYYKGDGLDRQLSGTPTVRQNDESLQRNEDIERERSFGRRRKPTQVDLEKGRQH